MRLVDLFEAMKKLERVGSFARDTEGIDPNPYGKPTAQHNGFVGADRKLLNKDNYEFKLKTFLQDTEHPFKFIFVQPVDKKHSSHSLFAKSSEPIPITRFMNNYNGWHVSQKEMWDRYDQLLSTYADDGREITYDLRFELMELAKKNVDLESVNFASHIKEKLDPLSINVICTTNGVGEDRHPITPWILLHRIGHHSIDDLRNGGNLGEFNVLSDEFYKIVTDNTDCSADIYSDDTLPFIYDVFTFKSARTKYMKNWSEYLYELFAQYVNTGQITCKYPKIGNGYTINDSDKLERELSTYAIKCNFQFELALRDMVGKVIIMN